MDADLMSRQQGRINEVCGKLAQECSRTGARLSLLGSSFFFLHTIRKQDFCFSSLWLPWLQTWERFFCLSLQTPALDAARSDWNSKTKDETWTDVEKQMFSQINDCMYLNVAHFHLYEDLLELWLNPKPVILHCSALQWSDIYLLM